MFALTCYLVFCFAFTIVQDDGNPWNFKDWMIFLFSWAIIPVALGIWIGEKFKKEMKEIEK